MKKTNTKKKAASKPKKRPSPRVIKRQEQWKEVILEEAQRIADAEGISKITALRLAETADISRATFYSLFSDVGPIIDDIYRRAKGRK